MILRYFSLGIFTKLVTGFDDTLTHIPIIAYMTRTKRGRTGFAIGVFLAICVAVVIALFFSYLLRKIPYYNYVLGILFFAIAASVYFEIFGHKEERQAPEIVKKHVKVKRISWTRFLKLMFFGFVFSFLTVIDDTFAYSSLFLRQGAPKIPALAGILFAALLEVMMIIYFSRQLKKLKYRKEITAGGLVILGVLVMSGVL